MPAAFIALALGSVALGSCSSGSSAAPFVVGTPDHAENALVRVDEAGVSGRLESGELVLSIPVTAIAERARGSLNVRLLSVDGKSTLGQTSAAYDLVAGAKTTLSARVSAPANASEQAELVAYSVRLDDGANGALRVTKSLLYTIPPSEVRLEGPATLRRGKAVSYRVRTGDSRTKQPLAGLEVEFDLLKDDALVEKKLVTTRATGDAEVLLSVADPGTYHVTAHVTSFGVDAGVDGTINVEDNGPKLLLTTDKPIYQPGQLINLRALALNRDGNAPASGEALSFEIEDAKGNKIFKKDLASDAFGIAATTFRLGRILNQGSFKVRVLDGNARTEKTVNVSQYALPKFDVAVKTDKPWYRPGQVVTGALDARYFFGKTLSAGSVLLELATLDVGETAFQTVQGTLDGQGHYQFSVTLPSTLAGLPLAQGNAAVVLRATITDSAGQKVVKTTTLIVSQHSAGITLVPESTVLVPGIENALLLFLTDPLGGPLANADVRIGLPDGKTLGATTDAFGEADLVWTPPTVAATSTFSASVTLGTGETIQQTFDFGVQSGGEHLVVRTDKSVYETGESVEVEVTSTASSPNVYIDWLNDGQAVEMRSLEASAGKARFSMPIDSALIGSNRVEAYIVDRDGNIVRAGRSIFARNSSALSVELTTDKTVYAPGTPAKLTFSVKDQSGAPKVAALGVQIVDQAVFGLVDAQPGLLRTTFELGDAFAVPQYEIHGPDANLSQLLFSDTAATDPEQRAAAQKKSAGVFAALKNTSLTGLQRGSFDAVVSASQALLAPSYDAAKQELIPVVKSALARAQAALELAGCSANAYYCTALNANYYDELARRTAQALDVSDFWGNAYDKDSAMSFSGIGLRTRGPDEKAGTPDDTTITFTYSDLGLQYFGGFPTEGPGGAFPGAAGAAAGVPGPNAGGGIATGAGGATGSTDNSTGNAAAPRVRKDFPETLYVNPTLITGPDGTASVDVDMADSITEWRVSSLANSADGKLGGGESGIRVFQDFFVDVNFPATLTRGDEVSFPIAIYNYLDTPQSVSLELEPADWYTALGSTSTTVALEPGQVLGASFPVRVEQVGFRTLTVRALGGTKSDAVARSVHVVPDGKAFPQNFSGSLPAGSATHTLSFPAGAVPGSGTMVLNVFPAFLAQAVQGMDSMLQVPNGCFEQTTSTAWPNVLVTEYMQETRQITPEIALKAESLMSAGYQRLLTFEHPGGGFSWFGTQDQAPYLSVTAFGLMEFADMARVQTVDTAMLERTRSWLVAQQGPDGSWKGDMSEFFSFQTSTLRNTAFVVWALASADYQGPELAAGIGYVKANLASEADAYTLGIVANALALAAPSDPALADVLSTLDGTKKVNGEQISWNAGETQTNFYSSGTDATVSATALVAHALLLAGGYKSDVDGALKFLTASKDPSGNFGSTQATIWSLRTLILAAKHGTDSALGTLAVSVDGAPQPSVTLTAAQSDVMATVDLSALAITGSHDVKLDFSGTGALSYNLVANYNLPWTSVPPEPQGPLAISVSYDKADLYVNDTVTATLRITNTTAAVENMILVTAGIPPGFDVQTDDFAPYLQSGVLSQYEFTGKQLVLYLSTLAPHAEQVIAYHLRASMPVKAVDGGAEARLYYEPEKRARAAAIGLSVTASP